MKLSIVIPAYFTNKHNMLKDTLRLYSTYSKDTLKNIEIIVVDDHSVKPINIEYVENKLNISLYRVDDDIKWNQAGAKNLGYDRSSCDWILFIDVDHYITEDQLNKVLNHIESARVDVLYGFKRKDENNMDLLKFGKGQVLVYKDTFKSFGGFDERYAGHYGFEDVEIFKHHLREIIDIYLKSRESIKRNIKEHHSLKRSTEHNKKLLEDTNKKDRLFLNFKWKEICKYQI